MPSRASSDLNRGLGLFGFVSFIFKVVSFAIVSCSVYYVRQMLVPEAMFPHSSEQLAFKPVRKNINKPEMVLFKTVIALAAGLGRESI